MKIKQYPKPATRAQVDKSSHLIVIQPEKKKPAVSADFPYAELLNTRMRNAGKTCGKDCFVTDLPNKTGSHLTLACVKTDISSFELLTLARKLAAAQLDTDPREITLCMPGLSAALTVRVAEAIISALLAATFVMPSYKKKPKKAARLGHLQIFDLKANQDFTRSIAEAEGNNLARFLTSLPPNELTPGKYRQRVSKLAKQYKWEMKFLDQKTLARKKAGAFLAVAQGSPVADAGIVHLRYKPAKRSSKKLALVGKGICFDTGGMNLKPARYMHGMHEDMEGSAVALGTLLALTQLKSDYTIDCWLALAQNHIGPKAYKQNDVVTASNGVSIEIIHTDAEGRMVLADTLAIAADQKPDMIIDYATLTGACVGALGTVYSGAFCNRDALVPKVIAAGRHSGERVWPFPSDEDYESDLESQIADIKQCTLGSEPDHILATRFLGKFVNDMPWLHIDLSAGNNKGGLAHIPTDTTGFGVRFTLDLLFDQKLLT